MPEEKSLAEKYKDYLTRGYLEVFLSMNSEKAFKARELFSIAEKAECRNTGWPIGVTLTRDEVAPYQTEDGIEAVIPGTLERSFDYWSINRNGDFYFIRTYQEDEKPSITKSGKSILWFDVHIWRISEILLYCLNLARELQIDFSKKIDVYISYHGLKDRVLSCNDPMGFWFDDETYFSRADTFEYQISDSVDYIKVNYKDLIYNIASELAYFFNRFELNRSVCDSIVDKFLSTKH